jgi:hypothetical protein
MKREMKATLLAALAAAIKTLAIVTHAGASSICSVWMEALGYRPALV